MAPSAESFLADSRDYVDAACALIEVGGAVEPIGLIASHGMELALKAYLLHCGMSVEQLRRDFGHDLNALWIEAAKRDLAVESDPPYWLQLLNHFYDSPYLFRYRPKGAATAIPHAMILAKELRQVLRVVGLYLPTSLTSSVPPSSWP
jgi:hypothetical protein